MRTKQGMTLVEIIVAMAIFAILIVMIFPALALLNMNNTISKEHLEATYYTQDIVEKLVAQSTEDNASLLTLKAYLVDTEDFDSATLQKKVADAPYLITVTFDDSDVTGSANLKRVVVLTESTNSATSEGQDDRSEVEMVLRFSEATE